MIYEIFLQFGTEEYLSNLAAEITGLFIEIIILTITIPILLNLFRFIRYKKLRFLLRMDTLQLYEKLTSAIVEFVLGKDKIKELTNLTCDDDFKYISNNHVYGQLDNNLLLITKKITSSDISKCIKNADSSKLLKFSNIFKECSLSFDRLISLLAFVPKKQSELYALRRFYVIVEKIFATYYKKKLEIEDPDPFISLEKSGNVIHLLCLKIDQISRNDRNKINRELRNKEFIQFAKFLPIFLFKKLKEKINTNIK